LLSQQLVDYEHATEEKEEEEEDGGINQSINQSFLEWPY